MKALLLLLSLLALPLFANPAFDEACALYNQGKFAEALNSFQSISGQSAALDYNIGNTLMRMDRKSEAIAYYRRALWQSPGDPDIRANLERAAEQTGAQLPPLPFLRRHTGFLHAVQWQTLFIILCWILAGLGILRHKSAALQNASAWLFPLSAALIICSGTGVWASRPQAYYHEAVLNNSGVPVRFEPLPDATEHFSLPSGSVVTLLDQNRDWYRISAAEKQGWIPAGQLFVLKTLGSTP